MISISQAYTAPIQISPVELSALIKKPNIDMSSLQKLFSEHSSVFNSEHYVAACLACVRIGGEDSKREFKVFASQYLDMSLGQAGNVSSLLHGAAKLGLVKDEVPLRLANAAVLLCATDAFTARIASSCIWSVAKLRLTQRSIVEPLAKAAVRMSPNFDAQAASNSLWAVATLVMSLHILFIHIALRNLPKSLF